MNSENIVPEEIIQSKIMIIRGKKVMLDSDLARLYGVTTGNLNKAVRRNSARFPSDFMFQITKEENRNLIFQFGRSSLQWGGSRHLPYAFTEQGVAMLSSVLQSEKAVQVNIQIIRIFTRLREIMTSHEELRIKIEEMENKYDKSFKVIFETIRQLMNEPEKPSRKIGFRTK